MSTFTISIPDCLFGIDSRKQTGEKLKEYGATKVVIMCDPIMVTLGYANEMENIVKKSGMEAYIYQCKDGEPTSGECDKAYEFAKSKNADGLVGIGGGSAMDSTKMVGLLLKNGGKAEEYIGYTNNKKTEIFKPIITLPTTAGTGAEVSQYISCSPDSLGTKGAAIHPPTFAIVDPIYTVDLPKSVTANTGVDALTHAVESMFNGREDKMFQWMGDTVSKDAIRIIFKWFPIAYADGKNLRAREYMSYAALLAGYAIKLRRGNYGHSLANQISNTYHFPHGAGCSYGLRAIMRYNVTGSYDTTRHIAEALGIECPEGHEEEVGRELVKKFDVLLEQVGMKTMKEEGITKEFVDKAVDNIKADSKWAVVPGAPNFDLMAKSIYDTYEM